MFRSFLTAAAVLAALTSSAGAEERPVTLKVMSFNIWYGGEQVSLGAVAAAIRAAGADIVGVQETDGNLARLSDLTGLSYYDIRRNILSRYPIFDPKLGERSTPDAGPYSMPPLDADAVAAYVMVAPGQYVAVANTHLTSDPYGPDIVRDGGDAAAAIQTEVETRVPEAQLLAEGLKPLVEKGIPTFLTGDFNSPSHLDWTEAAIGVVPSVKFVVDWPVSKLFAEAGLSDSYRVVHPDAAAVPGITWTAGTPSPYVKATEVLDRIDWVLFAHASPVASMVVGEMGGPDVGIAVMPWPSDHRAVVTTFKVVPVDAPALVAVEPARVEQGGDFLIRAFVPGFGDWSAVVVRRGGDAETDGIMGIGGASLTDRPTIRLSARRLAPGAYDVVLRDGDSGDLARTRFNVVAEGARPVLAVDKPSYAVGETIVASWTDALGERFEWLGVYAADDPNVYNYHGYVYTGGHVAGSAAIPPSVFGDPLPAGRYELRLLRDDAYLEEAVAAFTVE